MDIRKLTLLFHTLKYLKFIQIYYRFYYLFRNKFLGSEPKKRNMPSFGSIRWEGGIKYSNRYFKNQSFEFVNINHQFSNGIDWNYGEYGKLWTYNLNYFDFLNQSDFSRDQGLRLINDYIENEDELKDGKEPYPITLRIINWVKFLSANKVNNPKIDEILYHHLRILLNNLEYHLLANHFLENAFALLFGAYYFQDNTIYLTSKKLLTSQLDEQILEDGAHYELSVMYHQILFHRLLDCIQLIRLNSSWKKDDLLSFLEEKASMMRSWLEIVTYRNGDVPMVSDAAFSIASSTSDLVKYANQLDIKSETLSLSASGYRKITRENYELFLDVGNIKPSYQPGHTHSDTFHFDLYKDGSPIFVDTGISTYEKNATRQYERSTHSHNTVVIDERDQTQVWGGFRVAKRARVIKLVEDENCLIAVHDGYKKLGFLHKRIFDWSNMNKIRIEDDISRSTNNKAVASFHLHWSVDQPIIKKNIVELKKHNIFIVFSVESTIQIEKYNLPFGYNKFKSAYRIIVTFDRILVTEISL